MDDETVVMLEELLDILRRHTDTDRLYETSVPGLHLMKFGSRSQPLYSCQWPCLAFLVQGTKSLTFGDLELRYRPGQYLLASVELPVSSRVIEASPESPMLGLAVVIDWDLLARITVSLDDLSQVSVGSALTVTDAPPDLFEAVLRMVKLLDQPEHARGLAPIMQQEILYRLLTGPNGGRLLQLARLDSPSNRIRSVMGELRECFSRPLKVAELARHAGMSPSSFHHHFKAISGMTPIAYQKHLRLQHARRLMLLGNSGVGEASFRVGYQSPSQFSKDYRRYFGLTPREDVRALKEAGKVVSLDSYIALS
jgi:AraC-like DNA-binding protein